MPVDRNLAHLQPSTREKVRLWLNDCKAEKLGVWICETLRSFARSDELYAKGRTTPGPIVTNAKAGQSLHGFGFAVDVYPLLPNGEPDFNFDRHPEQMRKWWRVVQLAEGRGLVWGGKFKAIVDLPHFQDAEAPSLSACRQQYPKGYQA